MDYISFDRMEGAAMIRKDKKTFKDGTVKTQIRVTEGYRPYPNSSQNNGQSKASATWKTRRTWRHSGTRSMRAITA